MKPWLRISFALLAVVSFGCGGAGGGGGASPDPGACRNAPACGGDIVGSWSIVSNCLEVDVSSFTDGCPSATAYANGYQITGMVTYDASMMFTVMSTLSGSVMVRYPIACLTPASGAPVTCDALGPALLAPGKYASVVCLDNGAGCDCTIGITPETSTASGMYTITSDDVLTAGLADQSDYCVKGDGTAALGTHPGSPIMGHDGLTSGSLVLTKQ